MAAADRGWPSRPTLGHRTITCGDARGTHFANEAFVREDFYGAQQLPWLQSPLITNNSLTTEQSYALWHRVHQDNDARDEVLRERAGRLTYQPLISVVVPVFNTDPEVLNALIDSVATQVYPPLGTCARRRCLVVAGRPAPRSPRYSKAVTAAVRVERLAAGAGIVGATNEAIGLATRRVRGFPRSRRCARAATRCTGSSGGSNSTATSTCSTPTRTSSTNAAHRVEPYFKPDWSPDYLLSLNYVTHLLVVRRRLLDEVGGLRAGFDGAQDYDLLLRLTEHTDRIAHVPAPLYSWRKVDGSTSADIHAKPAAHRASERALDDAHRRRGLDAHREPGLQPTWHRVRYRITESTDRVGRDPDSRPCRSARAVYRTRALDQPAALPIEFVIVDNESRRSRDVALSRHMLLRSTTCVVRYPHRFNFARQMNLAALAAARAKCCCCSTTTSPVSAALGRGDARARAAPRGRCCRRPARVARWTGAAQHEGSRAQRRRCRTQSRLGAPCGLRPCIRNAAAVTAACLMTTASVYAAVGGMDERLRVAYNDVDLCLRIGERGWRIIYTPYAELEHAESRRGDRCIRLDEAFFQRRWGAPYTALDPFYTPNLELMQPWSPRL